MEKELVALSTLAGDAIRKVYESGEWDVTLKADRSPLTQADRASHDILYEGLTRIEPGIPILSEESEEIPYETRKDWEIYFLIDPLDGTREFVAKLDEFAVNIALVKNGRPIVGIIHSPMQRETFYAEKGKGAYKTKQTREKLPAQTTSETIHVLLSRTDQSPDLDKLLSSVPNHSVTRMGSSLKFSAVAGGEADFYPRLKPSMEWDTASGTILVEESGGLVVGLDGVPIQYNREVMLNEPFYVLGGSLFRKWPDWKTILKR